MNVGIKVGIAALSAGIVGAFAGSITNGEDGARIEQGLGIAAAGGGIAAVALRTSNALSWKTGGVLAAATGVGFVLGRLLDGSGAREGGRILAPGPERSGGGGLSMDEMREHGGLGRGLQLPTHGEPQTTNPRL